MGALCLVDLDDVCVANTNRQLPATVDAIGRPKVEVLAGRVVTGAFGFAAAAAVVVVTGIAEGAKDSNFSRTGA